MSKVQSQHVVTKASQLVIGQSHAIPVAYVHVFADLNEDRYAQPTLTKAESKNPDNVKGGVFESLRDKGWAAELPCQVIPLNDKGTLTDDGQLKGYTPKRAIEERKALIAKWEKDDATKAVAAVMRDVWFPNGK